MALQSSEIERVAERLLADYDAGRANEVFAQEGAGWLTVDEAYAVQRAVAELRKRRGEECLGYKVGCLSPAIQKQFGLQEPVYGHLWTSELLASGTRLSCLASAPESRRFVNLAVEGEIGVRLGRDVSPSVRDRDLAASLESWFPVIELHNYVFRGGAPTCQELVAGNAMHAGLVAAPGAGLPLAELTGQAEIVIKINGEVVETRRIDEIPAGPQGSVRWLASALARTREALRAGDIVLTGSPGKLIPILGKALVVVTCGPQRVRLTIETPTAG